MVLFVTGYIEQIKIAEGKENYLAKPFSSETLVRTVRRILSTKHSDASAFSGVAPSASGLHDLRGNF
jgi:two-component SAPR family response regulator